MDYNLLRKNWEIILILTIILTINSSLLIHFMYFDNTPQMGDSSRRVFRSYKMFKNIQRNGIKILFIYYGNLVHGPGPYLFTFPLFALFGIKKSTILIFNLFVSNLLLIGVYLLSREYVNKKAALISVFFILSTPSFIGYSRTYLQIYFLTLILVYLMYFLKRSNYFERGSHGIIMGGLFGLSLITTLKIIPYLIGPFIYCIYKIRNGLNKKRLLNIFLIILLGSTIFFSIYNEYDELFEEQVYRVKKKGEGLLKRELDFSYGDFSFLSPENLTYNIIGILRNLEIWSAFIALISCYLILKNWKNEYWFLFLPIIGAYIFFTFVTLNNKHSKLLLPSIPLISVFPSIAFEKLNTGRKKIFLLLIIPMLLIQIFGILMIPHDSSFLLWDKTNKTYEKGYKDIDSKMPVIVRKYNPYKDLFNKFNAKDKRLVRIFVCPKDSGTGMIITNHLIEEGAERVDLVSVDEIKGKDRGPSNINQCDYLLFNRKHPKCKIKDFLPVNATFIYSDDEISLYKN